MCESLYIKKPAGFKITGQTKTLYLANQTKGQNTLKPEKWVCTYSYECNEPQVLSNTQHGNRSSHLHSAAIILKGYFLKKIFLQEVQIISDSAAAPKLFSHLLWHSFETRKRGEKTPCCLLPAASRHNGGKSVTERVCLSSAGRQSTPGAHHSPKITWLQGWCSGGHWVAECLPTAGS